jgi:hypothetical protein
MKIYKTPWYSILILMFSGIIFFSLVLWNLEEVLNWNLSEQFYFIIGLIFSFVLLRYSFYLWRNRMEGKGIYWDDEGITIDLKGNKIYWDEIEDIRFYKGRGGKSTVIYPHYTNHEKIRIHHKKMMPVTAHSIEWFLVEKPKEMHNNLMKTWEEKRISKKKSG